MNVAVTTLAASIVNTSGFVVVTTALVVSAYYNLHGFAQVSPTGRSPHPPS